MPGLRRPAAQTARGGQQEADRDLLVQLLERWLRARTAASGTTRSILLAAGLKPDAILMDLAMPGIDGWETIRRARRLEHIDAKVAIVSANAFDKGLDNDAGVKPEDFILKPVRHSELLDWLERQLGLRWLEAATAPAPALPTSRRMGLGRARVAAALQQSVQLGYYRGS